MIKDAWKAVTIKKMAQILHYKIQFYQHLSLVETNTIQKVKKN